VCPVDADDEPVPLSAAEVRLLEFFDKCAEKGLRLYQFLRYAIEVYGIGGILTRVSATRKDPGVPTFPVLTSLLIAAVLRVPSINQLEYLLRTGQFQRMLGERLKKRQGKPLFSADTIVDVLDALEIHTLQAALAQIIKRAERNKAFRDDTFGTFICTAIDGWEPFWSYRRHCDACLTRQVKRKVKIGEARAHVDGIELDEEDLSGDPRRRSRSITTGLCGLPGCTETRPDVGHRADTYRGRAGGGRSEAWMWRRRGDHGGLAAHRPPSQYVWLLHRCICPRRTLSVRPVFEKLTEHHYGATIITRDVRKDPYRFAESVWQVRGTPT